MIQGASQHVYDAPWLMVPTGAVLALTVLAANAIGNALGKAPNAAASHLPSAAARRQRAKAVAAIAAAARHREDAAKDTLSVRSLSVGVDNGVRLVTDVSFDVEPGTVLGLVGESGCGKTMTALSLLGLLPSGVSVTGGQILWNGRNLAAATDKDMEGIRGRDIALISQEPMRALDPMFTVGYQLTAAIRRLRRMGKAEAKAEALSLLEKVGIVDAQRILKTYPHQISGGMAQRVAIALALSGRPRLLVADEPTTALDVTVQAEILSLLRSLVKDTGMSVVMVTHDLGVVADICDQVAVMYAGQVVENGKTARSSWTTPATPTRWPCWPQTRTPTMPRTCRNGWPPSTARFRSPRTGPPAAGSPPAASSPAPPAWPRSAAALRRGRWCGALRQGGRTGCRRPGLAGHRRPRPPPVEPV